MLIVAGQGGVPSLETGSAARVKPALDVLRRNVAAKLDLIDPNTLKFAFIVDFPMFEWDEDSERWSAVHHLFTSWKKEDAGLMKTAPGETRSNAYDIICNGWEIGCGSIRIHRREEQEQVFDLLGIGPEDAEAEVRSHARGIRVRRAAARRFRAGHRSHGRALRAGERHPRVIAFPKTKSASDLMTGAPSPIDQAALDAVGLQIKPGAMKVRASEDSEG